MDFYCISSIIAYCVGDCIFEFESYTIVVGWFVMKVFTKITNDAIADAFYDEDYEWLRDNLGFEPENQMDAEKKIEQWKYKHIKYQRGDAFYIPEGKA